MTLPGQLPLPLDILLPRKEERFDGETFDNRRDGRRITSQYDRVFNAMQDKEWHTLDWLARKCGGTVASVSARLRDMRKRRFGSHTVERKYEGSGLWKYRFER